MRRFLLTILAMVAMVLLCSFTTATDDAQGSPFPIQSVDVSTEAKQNGDMLVQDTFTYSSEGLGISFTDSQKVMKYDDHVDQMSFVMGTGTRRGDTHAEQSDPRIVKHTPLERRTDGEELPARSYLPHGFVDALTPNWQGEVSWVFNQKFLHQFRPTDLFPDGDWVGASELLHWPLRLSVIGLVVLLFFSCRIRKSRWPVAHLPRVGAVSTLPSDLPAPVVSVLAERMVLPRTYLSILLNMLQKGNVTISGTFDENDWRRDLQSHVTFVRRFEPDQPWEKPVFDALPVQKTNSADLRVTLMDDQAIRAHLDQCLLERGIFDEPPLQVMADRGQGCLAYFAWTSAAVILAIGVGLWVNLLFPWWAGAAVGIPAALVFLFLAVDEKVGRVNPTPEGAIEISRWFAFGGSLRRGCVSPTQNPSQSDPMLPYAVALNSAALWINDNSAVPPWFRPGGTREQDRHDLYMAYRGFIGADTWDLTGGPNIKATRSSSSGGGGGPGDGGGGG